MILIGSRALALQAPKLLSRKPADFDFVCSQEEFDNWLEKHSSKVSPTKIYSVKENKMIVEGKTNCEFEIIKPNTSSELLDKIVKNDPETIDTKFGLVPSLDILFALKTSHRYKKNSPFVFKTLGDWHLLKLLGAKIKSEHNDFLKLREKETYTFKAPSLTNQTKESFFSAEHGIDYNYCHDSLHEVVKYLDRPAYTYYAKENDPIKSDKDKFFACDHKVRLYGAIEEVSVLSLERAYLTEHKDLWTLESAWMFALGKVLTSITSGFFREWCWENGLEIIANRPTDYYEKFQIGLNNGVVKSFK